VNYWSAVALIDGVPNASTRITTGGNGRIATVEVGTPPAPGDIRMGVVLPGMGNAHSHSFHRALRGRTHSDGGDFWAWRTSMYEVAGRLDPDRYYDLALSVFHEMLLSGWTAVGEFHYVHHRPDGKPYDRRHAMELALAHAAQEAGIRLTLLDALYLTGGINRPLSTEQLRFSDGSVHRWLERWYDLRDALGGLSAVTLGAAVHSVRAVPPPDIAVAASSVPPDVPLHIHLSEQVQENQECEATFGTTPTQLLADLGVLAPRLSLVHATHLTERDIGLIGDSGAVVVLCPTTEADLGDGIGPARALTDAGARLALGSDQNAVIDPFLEARGLEAGERLASRRRGRFSPAELTGALTVGGYSSLGHAPPAGLAPGGFCDLVEIDAQSIRTVGALHDQLPLVATAADVLRVIVGGRIVADGGATPERDDPISPAARMARAIDAVVTGSSSERGGRE
jgi:formiminoglutamate deiminase